MEKEFTHVDNKNNPCMVDVGNKLVTERIAHAQASMKMPIEVMEMFKDGDIQSKKGPVFHTAIIAGTMAVKKTSDIIPFCHQLNIESCKININLHKDKKDTIVIDCTVKVLGKTGVEMEALTGASIAALTIYDMCKAFSHNMVINNAQLVMKTGGKSDYQGNSLC